MMLERAERARIIFAKLANMRLTSTTEFLPSPWTRFENPERTLPGRRPD